MTRFIFTTTISFKKPKLKRTKMKRVSWSCTPCRGYYYFYAISWLWSPHYLKWIMVYSFPQTYEESWSWLLASLEKFFFLSEFCFGSRIYLSPWSSWTVWWKGLKTASNQEVTTWKTLFLRNNRVKFLFLRIRTRPCILKSVNKLLSYYILFWVPFLLITLYKKVRP